jgi:hypothetical protein
MTPDDHLDQILYCARRIPDESRDEYFRYVSDSLRLIPNPTALDVRDITRNGVKLFGGRS